MRRLRAERSTRAPSSVSASSTRRRSRSDRLSRDEAGGLQPVDVGGHRRRRDALVRGQLADSDPGVRTDRPEERRPGRRSSRAARAPCAAVGSGGSSVGRRPLATSTGSEVVNIVNHPSERRWPAAHAVGDGYRGPPGPRPPREGACRARPARVPSRARSGRGPPAARPGYEEMTNLPAALRTELAASVPYSTLRLEHEARSRDGT